MSAVDATTPAPAAPKRSVNRKPAAKPKADVVAVTDVVTVVAADVVVPAVADVVVADTAVPAVVDVKPTKEHKVSKPVKTGTSISSARVRTYLDKKNLNAVLTDLLADTKGQVKQYNAAKIALAVDPATQTPEQLLSAEKRAELTTLVERVAPNLATLEAKAAAYNRERIRFSTDASIQLAIVLDELVQEMIEHGIKSTLASKKRIIRLENVFDAGHELLSLYPLIHSLPSYQKHRVVLREKHAAEVAAESLKTALATAEKEFRKKYNVILPKKVKGDVVAAAAAVVPAVAPAVEVVAEVTQVAEDTQRDNDFTFYITQSCNVVKSRVPEYVDTRIASAVREYLSDIVIELIQRLASLVLVTAKNMKIKTITEVALFATLSSLFIDGHKPVETIELTEATVADPAAVKAEAQKSADAKVAGTAYTPVPTADLPKVTGYVATRHISYPTSSFDKLQSTVQTKYDQYKKQHELDAAAAKEAKKLAEASV